MWRWKHAVAAAAAAPRPAPPFPSSFIPSSSRTRDACAGSRLLRPCRHPRALGAATALLGFTISRPAAAPFTSTASQHKVTYPPRPKPPPDEDITESYLKGSGPGGQKIVCLVLPCMSIHATQAHARTTPPPPNSLSLYCIFVLVSHHVSLPYQCHLPLSPILPTNVLTDPFTSNRTRPTPPSSSSTSLRASSSSVRTPVRVSRTASWRDNTWPRRSTT